MMTQILGLDALPLAARLIKQGEVVGIPTETVYGLGADAFSATAVKKIFLAKGRPQDNPLIVHIADIDFLPRVAVDIPQEAYVLFAAFSPGPLTIVLNKHPSLPTEVTAGLNTVGVRIPDNDMTRKLIRLSGTALAAPSANTSSRVSPSCAMHVYEDLNGKIPLILDGGACSVGIESTVLDLTKQTPTILRPGAITATDLLQHLGSVKTHKGEVQVAEAPGMKYKHYAPLAECVLAETPMDAARAAKDCKKRALIIGTSSFVAQIEGGETLALGDTVQEVNRAIYAALRDAEKQYDLIILQHFSGGEEWGGVVNRTEKSAGGKSVK